MEKTVCQHFQTRRCRSKFLIKQTGRQGSRYTGKVEILILSKFESSVTSLSMKRRQASVVAQRRIKGLKVSPKENVATRTKNRTKQRNIGAGSRTFSWDPDSFCSDSDSSVVIVGNDGPLSVPVINLTGKSNSDTEHLINYSSASSTEDVVLSNSEEEEEKIQQVKSRKSSFTEGKVWKISLHQQSATEDTLETFRLNNSGRERKSSAENSGCVDCQQDDTNSVKSGPSSPHSPLLSVRCTECQKLFTKMRKPGKLRPKKRDHDPASLSCDHWILNKTWRPQRRRPVKGRLWVHLKRIRKLALEQSANATWPLCSRPHVFLQRNLRHCKQSIHLRPPESNASLCHQPRPKAQSPQLWRSAKNQTRKKNKSLVKDSVSENLDFITEEELPARDNSPSTSLQQQRVLKKQPITNTSSLDNQVECDGLERTRRVLKFDEPLSVLSEEMQKPKPGLKNLQIKLHKLQADSVLTEDMKEFRTPVDTSNVEPEIVRKSRPSYFVHTSGVQKGSFRSMLAAFENSRNQIIKEPHN